MKKYFIKIGFCVFSLSLFLYINILNTAAEDEINSDANSYGSGGEIISNITWSLDDSGTLNIYGSGSMEEYDSKDPLAPWFDEKDKIKEIIIEEGIESIGNWSFKECSNLERVIIPSSVTTIGDDAFFKCESLITIELPSSVRNIGAGAFRECRNLECIDIPASVSIIRNGTFMHCSHLDEVCIPSSVTTIESCAFYNCTRLKSIYIPSTVELIEDHLFMYSNNVNIYGDKGSETEKYANRNSIPFHDGSEFPGKI